MKFPVPAKSRAFPPGFTLIELSMVILVMTLLFSIAVPRFSELSEFNLRSSARKLAAQMRYLYAEAVFRKTYFSLVFDLSSGSYWVEVPRLNTLTQELEMLEVEDQMLLARRELPSGIRFSEIKTGSGESGEEDRVTVNFFPGGYADPATIHLKDKKEREYTVFLIPLSGRVLVRQGYFEFSQFES